MSSLVNWLSSDAKMDGIGCMVEKLSVLVGFETPNSLKYPLCDVDVSICSQCTTRGRFVVPCSGVAISVCRPEEEWRGAYAI